MSILISSFPTSPFVTLPQGILGWSGWLLLLSLDVYLLFKWKFYNKFWGKNQKYIFFLLLLIIPVCVLLFGIQSAPEPAHTLPPSGSEITIMLLSAIPWMLAGGLLGINPAAVIGLLTGITFSLWHSNSIFTPLEIALFAVLYSAAVLQNYRSPFFNFLRQPFLAAFCLVLTVPWVHSVVLFFASSGTGLERFNSAISSLPEDVIVVSIPILLGGLVCSIVAHFQPDKWGSAKSLVPSPYERSLRSKLSLYMLPLVLFLTFVLLAGSWISANRASRSMAQSRMSAAANICEENLTHFFKMGETILTDLAADERLFLPEPSEIDNLLQTKGFESDYYDELLLVDNSGNLISAYGDIPDSGETGPVREVEAVRAALKDASVKIVTFPPMIGNPSAIMSVVVPVFDADQKINRLLVGRTNLDTNPYTQPVLSGLSQLTDLDGTGMLLDQDSRILVHPHSQMVYSRFNPMDSDGFGTRADYSIDDPGNIQKFLLYQRHLDDLPWSLVFSVPVLNIQKSALTSTAPLAGLIIAVALLAVFFLLFAVKIISNSLSDLARGAGQISNGRIEYPLQAKGSDEFAQLGRSFEKMRNSMRDQMDELNKLLAISQIAASNLNFSEVVEPILEAALSTGADSARVVLNPAVLPELEGSSSEQVRYYLGDFSGNPPCA